MEISLMQPAMKKNRHSSAQRPSCGGGGDDLQQRGSNSGAPYCYMDRLCDDLLLSILAALSSRAHCPADLLAVTLTCKRLQKLGTHTQVLAHASRLAVAVRATTWGPNAHSFLLRCAESGSMEAAFTLGIIEFYCLDNKREGMKLLARAATARHGAALFAMAVLQLNGSSRGERNATAGVALCAKAAMTGCVEAIRELGLCVKEGEGVRRADVKEGRRLLREANSREALLFIKDAEWHNNSSSAFQGAAQGPRDLGGAAAQRYQNVVQRCLESDCGCPLPLGWLLRSRHPADRFLSDWRVLHGQRIDDHLHDQPVQVLHRYCSNKLCGRSETRPSEFRQCAACCSAFYCTRSCQSLDWKLRHLLLCRLPASMPSPSRSHRGIPNFI